MRGLDQNGPGDEGQNLATLWRNLVESSDKRFHAAEESTLRWLLKSMNGPSPAAETLRRYPLTWAILDAVFRRIPLFSLAKSLADRRFLGILQQTLKEVSVPQGESAVQTSSKRKRSGLNTYALEDLRSSEGCLSSAQAVLGAVSTLLQRINSSAGASSHDRIGAEHIKSLFNLTASDAVSLVAPALVLCNLLLHNGTPEDSEEYQSWIQTINSMWDLHLQGSDDTYQIATFVFGPVVLLLDKLEGETLSSSQDVVLLTGLQKRWANDLRAFMRRNLVLPARAVYMATQEINPITDALIATEDKIGKSAPVLYSLIADVSSSASLRGSRKVHEDWLKEVFRAIRSTLHQKRNMAPTLQSIFSKASASSMPIALEDLRSVCQKLALGDEVNWPLVASIAKCDPDVFQKAQDGRDLLKDVCNKSLDDSAASEENRGHVLEVIESVLQGFRTARDFSGFLRLWYQQLCEAERNKAVSASPWFQVGRKGGLSVSIIDIVEKDLTPKLLLDVLGWVKEQKPREQALCLWLSVISEGINREEFKDAACEEFHSLLPQIKKSSAPIAALRWRVTSRIIAWSPPGKRSAYWEEAKPRLSSILRKSPIRSAEAFEAFKCGCQAWAIFIPDDEKLEEAADLVQGFTKRLAEEEFPVGDAESEDFGSLFGAEDAKFDEGMDLRQYLGWYIKYSSRLQLLHYSKEPTILPLVLKAKGSSFSLGYIWESLLSNEHNLNDGKLSKVLIDYSIEALRASRKEQWSGDVSGTWVSLLNQVPVDAVARPQRESIMSLLMGRLPSKKEVKASSLAEWKALTSLATKLMSRPTFYEGMEFSHLVDVADLISTTATRASAADEELLEMIGRYSSMASSTIGQMTDHLDERSERYFAKSADFISSVKSDGDSPKALRLTLLKVLIQKSASASQLTTTRATARDALAGRVVHTIGEWVADKKLLSKPDASANFALLAAVDAAGAGGDFSALAKLKGSSVRKLEKRSREALGAGDVRGWKVQSFLRTHLAAGLEDPRPTQIQRASEQLTPGLGENLVREFVASVVAGMEGAGKMQYLGDLIGAYKGGWTTDGQLIAVQYVVDQLVGKSYSSLILPLPRVCARWEYDIGLFSDSHHSGLRS